eukprot:jgi/Botrbrau1/16163/Bobra.0272s0001.1
MSEDASEVSNDRDRFLLELEFVQCLANPGYINWLAQNRYFDDSRFINYLKYLLYWKQPEYSRFIIYPHCLFFLDLLQSKDFRTVMARASVKVSTLFFSSFSDVIQHFFVNKLRSAWGRRWYIRNNFYFGRRTDQIGSRKWTRQWSSRMVRMMRRNALFSCDLLLSNAC